MKTLPERFEIIVALALWTAAACAACTARAEPQPPEARPSSQATAFLQARALPPEASPTAAEVEVRGAVGRPGRLKLAPGVETLEQALQAAGGLLPEAVAVRVRPGKDPLHQLFAESADQPAEVDLPVAALVGHGVVYLRPGDLVEAVPPQGSIVPPDPAREASADPIPSAAPTTSTGGPPTAPLAEPSPSLLPSQRDASAAPGEARAPGAAEQVGALADIRDQLTALRSAMEKQNDALRAQIEELRGEQTRLRASLDQASRPRHLTAPPPPPQRSPEPAAVPSSSPADAPGGVSAAPSATVVVSGAVKKPGVYPVADVKTVAGAISAAGRRGDADLSAVEIRPQDQGGALLGIGLGLGGRPAKRIVDLPAVASGKTADLPLVGGEVIFVPATRGRGEPVEAAR